MRAESRLANQLGKRDLKSPGDAPKIADSCVISGALDTLYNISTDLCPLGKLLLGEVAPDSPVADAVAEGATVVEEPGRMILVRHSTTVECRIS